MKRFCGVVAAAALSMNAAGCGEEQRSAPPQVGSPKVAATLEWPGQRPWALITYHRTDGRPCHALGVLTAAGPRLIARPNDSLSVGLQRYRGHCLEPREGRGISIDAEKAPGGAGALVGGVAAPSVRRVTIAGQHVRPGKDGSFLMLHPAASGRLKARVDVDLRNGHRRTLRLDLSKVSG
jgi:hypothetical protein